MVSATGHNYRAKPEDLLPPQLQQQILQAIRDKLALTEEGIEMARMRVNDTTAALHSANRLRAAGLKERANRRGVSQVTDIDVELGIQAHQAYRAYRAAKDRLQSLMMQRKDLQILERRAKAGLKDVILDLSHRWSGVYAFGVEAGGVVPVAPIQAWKLRDFVATLTGGIGDVVAGAVGPAERAARSERRRKVQVERRETEKLDQAEQMPDAAAGAGEGSR